MLKFYLISIMVCFIIIKIPKANIHIKHPDIKVKQTHFYEKKNVLDNVMCPDSDRYFNFISIYRWQSMQYRGSPQSEWWHSDVQSKKMPVWLRVCWQKEHVCCVLSYRTWKITNTGICNTDLVLFCLLVSFKI